MKNYMNNDYLQEKYMQKMRWYHFCLGIRKIRLNPFLLALFFPILALTIFIWLNMDSATTFIDMPEFCNYLWSIIARVFGVIIPVLLCLAEIMGIGTLASRKDEAIVQTVFPITELRKGNPILTFKGRDKERGYIIRDFYTLIPLSMWESKKDDICSAFNEHLVGDLHLGGKHNNDSNRIIIISAKGRRAEDRGNIYDDDI